MTTIDVIIPSYRLNEDFLLPILSLDKPQDCYLNYIVIADNPGIEISNAFSPFMESGKLSIIKNTNNLGAPISRNVGIDKGDSDWILFLDDDTVPNKNLIHQYVNAISNNKNEVPGFIGPTEFPPPRGIFEEGILSSDILTFFTLSRYYDEMAWGVTANILVKREALNGVRFSDTFPKKGGGEDIDFCLNAISGYKRRFVCVPNAKVIHPWWEGKINSYKRFFRWAFGDSLLPIIHPEYKYYNFPNVVEAIFIILVTYVISYTFFDFGIPFIIPVLGIFFGETIGEWLKQAILKKDYSFRKAFVSMTVRASNDLGRLIGNMSRKRLNGLFERFDYFCDGKHVKHEKKWALIKFGLYITSIILFIEIYLIIAGG